MAKLKFYYNTFFRSKGVYSFLSQLGRRSKVLDVGCGNDSSFNYKTLFPDLYYVGIDIGDYNQKKPIMADEYIITSPEKFSEGIAELAPSFDAVISSHNLEHCNDRHNTLKSMLSVLKPGGEIYLSFPSEKSINFPKRNRTLNYYDDETHKLTPPKFDAIIDFLKTNNFSIEYSSRQYQPLFLRVLGFIQEPFAAYKNTIFQGTWAYFGFESIIWAKKLY
jgi:SAM-dependent methyltransferase